MESDLEKEKKKIVVNGSHHLLVESVPVPNSFLSKLIFYLHIKGNERRIQNHNPELSLCFFWCTKKKATESLREHCEQQ